MIMQLKNIVKSFAGNVLLQNIQIDVRKNDRIALVGRNGTGKSTLLKILIGEIGYDSGEIYKQKDVTIGYLEQHHGLSSTRTIWEEMLTVFQSLIDEEKALLQLAEKISEQSSNGEMNEKLLNEYTKRTEQFEADGGYRFKSDIKGVLIGLGFPEEDFSLLIGQLSGGQKTRLSLGKLLLENPNLLVLDEPTNHLDISTLTWLENYLVNYKGALIIVSHDRYFIDKIVTKVYEIEHKQASLYHGTYSDFLQQKEERIEKEWKQYEKQQKEIAEAEQFIQRNIARASTTGRAQSRRVQLEKLEKIERPKGSNAKANFSFDIAITSGRDVLSTKDYSFRHDGMDEYLFKDVSFSIKRGERIALIGENGVGKTSLLRAILSDHVNFDHGANVQIGYYAQEQETLDEANTILEEVWGAFPHKAEQEIRTVLGNFLFSGDDVLKHIHQLSGGEKARVSLAKLMLKQANFLILDEPTNHLDLISKEILEEALQTYPGTIFFVSHDRYFINKITDRIFELEKNGLTIYLGNYDYYLEKKEQMRQIELLTQVEEKSVDELSPNKSALSFEEQKRVQREQRKKEREIIRLEKEIETLEEALVTIEEQMTDPNNLNDHEKLYDLSNEANKIKNAVEQLFEQWTELQQ